MERLVKIYNGFKDRSIRVTITTNEHGLVEFTILEGSALPAGWSAYYRIPEPPGVGKSPNQVSAPSR